MILACQLYDRYGSLKLASVYVAAHLGLTQQVAAEQAAAYAFLWSPHHLLIAVAHGYVHFHDLALRC